MFEKGFNKIRQNLCDYTKAKTIENQIPVITNTTSILLVAVYQSRFEESLITCADHLLSGKMFIDINILLYFFTDCRCWLNGDLAIVDLLLNEKRIRMLISLSFVNDLLLELLWKNYPEIWNFRKRIKNRYSLRIHW